MRRRPALGAFLALVLGVAAQAAIAGGPLLASRDAGPSPQAVTATSLVHEYYDFFNVPWPEYWDLRGAVYNDRPIGAECFSQAGIAAGHCTPSNPSIPDVDTYPYTNWYPGAGAQQIGSPTNDIFIQAPYRMRVTGTEVTGYTLAEPVYFPVLAPSVGAGNRLEFDWDMHYLTVQEAADLESAPVYCPPLSLEGYHLRSIVRLTMDLQESKRLFGVVASNPDEARTWWTQNTDAECAAYGPLDFKVVNWFAGTTDGGQGGSSFRVGKYDIYNSFEWFYQPYFLQMSATVDADGTTHVMMDHVAWGTEVLLARWFYWGRTFYRDAYLDSTKAQGWWGNEIAWFEDLRFTGSFRTNDHSFTLNTVMNYHLQQLASPGPNGIYDHVDDIPIWQWGAWLNDYVNDFGGSGHLLSELDRLPGKTLMQSTPGHVSYGKLYVYDYTPNTWDLKAFERATFRFPTGNVVFYDPNMTPEGAHPLNQYVEIVAPLDAFGTVPSNYGSWDPATKTLTLVGPAPTGGPVGSPGPDGTPGTADDQYPLEPFPQINIGPQAGAQIAAPWSQLALGQTMQLTVVGSLGGAALSGAAVTLTATSGLTLTPASGTTGADGTFITTVLAGTTTGPQTITATVSRPGVNPGTRTFDVNVIEALSMTMSASSATTEMMSFETATIRVRLESAGVGVAAGLITPSTRFGGTFGPVTELGGGSYAFGWTAPVRTTQGFASIDVRAKVGGYTDATARVTFLVDPNTTNTDAQLFLLSSLPATSVNAGGTLQVTIFLFTIVGFVVSGGTVTARLFGPGSLTVVVDELNGVYRLTYIAPASVAGPTNIRIDITATKATYGLATTRVGITVLP